jgi:hypothetical protein
MDALCVPGDWKERLWMTATASDGDDEDVEVLFWRSMVGPGAEARWGAYLGAEASCAGGQGQVEEDDLVELQPKHRGGSGCFVRITSAVTGEGVRRLVAYCGESV